jgi:acetoin utilization protein AcuB
MTNPNKYLVADAMTANPISVDHNQTLMAAKAIFEAQNIHHILVENNGKLVGILSKSDFYQASHMIGLLKTQKNEEYNDKFYETVLTEDIMTTAMQTVEPSDTLDKVVALFRKNKFHAVPVVHDGVGVGIITTFDLIFQAYENDRVIAF